MNKDVILKNIDDFIKKVREKIIKVILKEFPKRDFLKIVKYFTL